MIRNLSSQLSSTFGKKKLYISLIFILNAIMLVVVMASYLTAYHPDQTKIVHSDTHLISVGFEADGYMEDKDYKDKIKKYYKIINSNHNSKTFLDLESGYTKESKATYDRLSFTFYGNKYQQIKFLSDTLNDCSILPNEHLDRKKMICGNCKDDKNSIVLDKWLADRLINSDSIVLKAYQNYDSFIGKQIQASGTGKVLTITGICDTNEPTIYANQCLLLELAGWTNYIAYGDSTLYQQLNKAKDNKIVNQITENIDQVLEDCIEDSGQFVLYTNNINSIEQELQSLKKTALEDHIRIEYECKADKEMREYNRQYAGILRSFTVIAAAAMVLSIIMIYFIMKSNVLAQKHSLMIYMINGVSTRNLTLSYLWEMLGVMNITILPAVVLLSCGIKVATECLYYNIVYSFPVMFVILATLYGLNIIFVVVPVWNILRRPIARQGLIDS